MISFSHNVLAFDELPRTPGRLCRVDRQTHQRRATHLDAAWTSLRDPVTPTTHSSALDVSAFPYSASAGPERLATRPDRYPLCRAQVRFSAARQRFRGGAHRRYFRAADGSTGSAVFSAPGALRTFRLCHR